MADTKISALTAATQVDPTDEFAINQAGVSKKASAALLRQSSGALPTINSVGSAFSSTAAPTATLPGVVAANDILVLVLQSSQQSIATPAGYARLGPQNGIGAAAAAGSTRLGIFWKRAGSSESAPTIADSGDHTYGVMFTVRGCPTTGDPFRMLGQAWKFTASTTGTADAGTARTANSLIVSIFAHAVDSASAQGSSPTNASLSAVTEVFDGATTDGTGGGIYVMSGAIAVPGDVAASTVTWANSTVDVSTTIAFVPADSFPVPRGPEVWTFIGSAPNLDDVWTKPSGARKVFAQVCDGGGGGSGGNTTTTAAGGGGGGGGYDEAWYEVEELGATVTVQPGAGGAAGTALNQAGNIGTISQFDKGNAGPLTSSSRVAGVAATAAASADGGNGGSGSGRGTTSPAVATGRAGLTAASNAKATGGTGASGGSGTTAPVGGSEGDWGGGGGESGGDTDAAITSANNGNSMRGAGGGSGGRTNTNISGSGRGGGAAGVISAQGASGTASARLPYGGSGGVGGGSSVVTGGPGGFPGGGGGGGAGVAGGFGGAGAHGMVMVTTFF